jgi:hypothetical protein
MLFWGFFGSKRFDPFLFPLILVAEKKNKR